MRRLGRWLTGGLLALVLTGAVGWTPADIAGGNPAPPRPDASDATATPHFSVVQALSSGFGEPMRVNGFLVIADGETRLCQALTRSLPPRCAGTSLAVAGIDLSGLPLVSVDGVTWSGQPVTLFGTVSEGTLTAVLHLR